MSRILFASLIIFLLSGCIKEVQVPRERAHLPSWEHFERGSIVPDGSFEAPDASNTWSGSGCRISNQHARDGRSSLHLSAGADAVTVCVSPLIPLVPGHYEGSLWIKTEGLKLHSGRWLNEAVRIRLRLFDSHGEEIDALVSHLGVSIDSHELSYSLNRVSSDPTLPADFFRATLVPRYYPFDAGWIDAQAHFGQFELILNGPGEVWIDDVSWRYSKWNFSLAERVRYLRGDSSKIVIFPPPQEIGPGVEWDLGPASEFCLLMEDRTKLPRAQRQKLQRILGGFDTKLRWKFSPQRRSNIACEIPQIAVFLEPAAVGSIARKPGAYRITPAFHPLQALSRTVVLEAADASGYAYALDTLLQLLRESKQTGVDVNQVTFLAQAIHDYPVLEMRAASGRDRYARGYLDEIGATTWLSEARLSHLFIDIDEPHSGWWPAHEPALQAAKLIRAAKGDGMFEFGIFINPYLYNRPQYQGSSSFQFSNAAHRERLWSTIELFLSAGANEIILRTDDFAPRRPREKFGFSLDSEDEKVFESLAHAHGFLVSFLRDRISQRFPSVRMYFVPPWYNLLFSDLSGGAGEQYLSEITSLIPAQVPIVWTGPTVRSLFIDRVHVERFRKLLGGRELMLWDNSLYARRDPEFWGSNPSRISLASLLEPYDVNFEEQAIPNLIFMNSHLDDLFRIQLATFGAFAWNPKAYHPERALWAYLTTRFGPEDAELLLQIDADFSEYQSCVSEEGKEQTRTPDCAALLPEVRSALRSFCERTSGGRTGLCDELKRLVFDLTANVSDFSSLDDSQN